MAMKGRRFLSAPTRSFSDRVCAGDGAPGNGPGDPRGSRPPLLYCRGIHMVLSWADPDQPASCEFHRVLRAETAIVGAVFRTCFGIRVRR
jgi:hypothetical protein